MTNSSFTDDPVTVSTRYVRPKKATDRRDEANRPAAIAAAQAAGARLVVDVEDTRQFRPGEAGALLSECIALACKRLDVALRPALEDLGAGVFRDPTAVGAAPQKISHKDAMANAVRSKPEQFVPCFTTALKQAFERRRDGIPRGQRAEESISLAMVEHGTHLATVALKSAVLAMREATSLEAFALDLRVRALLQEEPQRSVFDNPFSSDHVCDALGSACRELWPEQDLWRPIMRRLVRVLTPHVVELHRDLNTLLKEQDVLPALNIRTRATGGNGNSRTPGGSELYQKLIELGDPDAPGPPTANSIPAGGQSAGAAWGATAAANGGAPSGVAGHTVPTPAGDAAAQQRDAQLVAAFLGALTYLQHATSAAPPPMDLGGVDREALRNGTGNELRTLKQAFAAKGTSALDRVTIDIVAGVLDCVFDNPHLPDEIKAVFGRLQIPVLKAAVLDRRVLSDPTHPVRRLLENLVSASIDLQAQSAKGSALIGVAKRIAQRIHDEFEDDLSIFETAGVELDAFLDAEQAGAAEWLALKVNESELADVHDEAQAVLGARRAQHSIPPAVQDFLDHEIVERLTKISLVDGRESPAWDAELDFVDELLWSIEPKANAEERKRLVDVLPSLLLAINRGWEAGDPAQVRRSALLLCLFDFHLRSLKSACKDPAAIAPAKPEAPLAAESAPVKPVATPPVEADVYDAEVQTLRRGDWCEFTSEDSETTQLARLAWRSTLRRRLLFCFSDGSTALVHTPESLATAFRSGNAVMALEGIPLFDRAMTSLIAKRSLTSNFGASGESRARPR